MSESETDPQLYIDRETKPADWLPDGVDTHDLEPDTRWANGDPENGLERRIGKPRVQENIYYPEMIRWVRERFKDDPKKLACFEAGCGNGNDLRALKKEFGGKGSYLGIDMSRAELKRGLEFYAEEDGEETAVAAEMFAQGDLRNLHQVYKWKQTEANFTQPTTVGDADFNFIYMEAVLHGLGYGQGTYKEKKAAAQQALKELARVCETGGRFFGRASSFDVVTPKDEQFAGLRAKHDWRFFPDAIEFEDMLRQAGFQILQKDLEQHGARKGVLRFSFLAEKIKDDTAE